MMAHMGSGWALGANASNEDWGTMGEMMRGMMGPYAGPLEGALWGLHWIFGALTWILIIALLAVLVRYFWRKGGK